jgi:hypothetical protein
MSLDRVYRLLQSLETNQPILPPTELYCEGWLLRIILDWYATHAAPGDPLTFAPRARWFSEAYLASPFKPRHQGDPHGEARSHADGVMGHFTIGDATKAGLSLNADATCLVVLEAKLFSGLSAGTKHAKVYNQAARSVACMAETLKRANRPAQNLERLAFYVLAPRQQLKKVGIDQAVQKSQIDSGVQARIQDYGGDAGQWYANWFQPMLQCATIDALAWEDVIALIAGRDALAGQEIGAFYAQCLRFGPSVKRKAGQEAPTSHPG